MAANILESAIIEVLKTVYDPEIPVNIWELGLVYEIKIENKDQVKIVMTLTAPGCPVADQLVQEVHDKVLAIPQVNKVDVELTFEPTWTPDNMSEEAKLELGFL
jgi:FeS assembly SUF system protein